MIGQLIDGKAIAAKLRGEVAVTANALRGRGITPTLAVVLVGDDPASAVYVKSKTKAAREAGVEIRVDIVQQRFHRLAAQADLAIVEGAGGWFAPIDDRLTMADIAKALDLPIVLVVGVRLGCLNHALLTEQAIAQRGLPLAGWVANCTVPGVDRLQENLDTLVRRTKGTKARPLLIDGDPRTVFERLMVIRRPLYEGLADLRIETTGRQVRGVAAEIEQRLARCIANQGSA